MSAVKERQMQVFCSEMGGQLRCRQDKTSVMHQIKECQDQLSEKKARAQNLGAKL